MRVIKEDKTERVHKCKHCKTIYAYTMKEVHVFIYRTLHCPVCGELNYLSKFDKKIKERKEKKNNKWQS